MVATTPINALRMAELTDAANAQTAFANLGADLDNKLVPVFTSISNRDSTITSPTEGMMCYVSGTVNQLYVYASTAAWVPVTIQPLRKTRSTTQSITSSTTLTNDNTLFLSVQANSTYEFYCLILATGATAGSMKWDFTGPTGWDLKYLANVQANSTNGSASSHFSLIGTDVGNWAASFFSPAYNFCRMEGRLTTGGTPGTLQLRWAQNASNGTATVMQPGSRIQLIKI